MKAVDARSGRIKAAAAVLAVAGLLALLPAVAPNGSARSLISLEIKNLAAVDGGPGQAAPGIESGDRGLGGRAETAGGLARLWAGLAESAVGSRVLGIGGWIVSFFRFLWTIPKALIQGDSRSMIDALGDLLSRTSPQEGTAGERTQTPDAGPGSQDRPAPAADPRGSRS